MPPRKVISPFPAAPVVDPFAFAPQAPPRTVLPLRLDWPEGHEGPITLSVMDVRTGRPVSLTGWTIRLTVRRTIDGTAIVDRTADDAGITLVDDDRWRIELQPAAMDWSAAAFPTMRPSEREVFVYDVEITPSSWHLQTPVRPFVAFGGQIWLARDIRP